MIQYAALSFNTLRIHQKEFLSIVSALIIKKKCDQINKKYKSDNVI